tara:strand:+ start:1246 stop:1551 length:306 start_codon:yes stop_codon:yes gene_type:complete
MKKDSLYIIQSDVTGDIKIGRSKNPPERLKQLQTGNQFKLKLLCELPQMGHKEVFLHRRLSNYKTKKKGEWFKFECTGLLPDWLSESIDWDIANTWWEQNQ